ncbi:unnamed protein product [marine sediment metagenome]|uniref:Uncharacterized protein n=1 Tax=marine sediment metagenome TaxID=412755 RepID=X1V1V1_9ZZZZ
MAKLELEITDKMMQKLHERAETYAVEPSDVAKSIISHELARTGRPCWMDVLVTITSQISDAVIAVSKGGAEESKQK